MYLLNKHNFAIAALASKESSRYTLQAIEVSPEGTAVTDGYVLCVVSAPEANNQNFPAVDGFEDKGDGKFILPADQAARIAKALPVKSTIPILKNAAVSYSDKAEAGVGNSAAIAVTDLAAPQVFRTQNPNGQFPNYKRILDQPAPTLRMAFNAKQLGTVLKQVAGFTDDRASEVVFSFTDAQSPVKFEARNDETGQIMQGCVMPLRMEAGVAVSPVKVTVPAELLAVAKAITDGGEVDDLMERLREAVAAAVAAAESSTTSDVVSR
jgi:DNA polymerase III sliding clamp (beta) subunit (PCNA family)